MTELTPLAKEANGLRSWVAEAHRDTDKAEKAFEALSVRSHKDNEEATKVRKEDDELLQKNAKTRQRVLNLLAEVEKERELKLGAEEKLMTLEKWTSLEATAFARLCKEWDKLHQTMERLHLERGTAHEEHD